MASDPDFVEFVTSQMEDAGAITSRKMFGEYALYCDGKVVALICDNQLFVKPTPAGRAYIGDVLEAPPYQGASMYFLIEDKFENRDWISGLVRLTAKSLAPAKKVARSSPRAAPGRKPPVPRKK